MYQFYRFYLKLYKTIFPKIWNSHVSALLYRFYQRAISFRKKIRKLSGYGKSRRKRELIHSFRKERYIIVFYFSVLIFRELFNFYYKFPLHLKKYFICFYLTSKVIQLKKISKMEKNWTVNY